MTLCPFLLLHSMPTLQTRCCRNACRRFLAGMQLVLSRMLLSTGGPSDPIWLRYFPVTVRDCQELESTKSHRIWFHGHWEKGKQSKHFSNANNLILCIIAILLLQYVISATFRNSVSHWIFTEKEFLAVKSSFCNEKWDLKSENCLGLPTSDPYEKGRGNGNWAFAKGK